MTMSWRWGLGLVLATFASSAEAAPWYARPNCVAAAKLVFAGDLSGAEVQKKVLLKGDADNKACSVWVGAALSEMRIALFGRTKANLEIRKKALGRMFGFAKHFGKRAQRFADLELEARSRRVRVLIDEGERTDALKEVRRAKKMLETRRKDAEKTATFAFVKGGLDLAVSSASWPMRTVLTLVGLGGDGDRGKKAFDSLWANETVYKYDALYSARHFAGEVEDGPLGKPSQYSQRLFGEFSGNHQFIFDVADDWRREGRCKEGLEHLAPTMKALDETPKTYSGPMRARLFWIIGRCAKDVGDIDLAKAYAKRARDEGYPAVEERLSQLESEL